MLRVENRMGLRIALMLTVALAAPATAQADVIISSAATSNMSCSGGVCAPTAKKAVLNVSDLQSYITEEGNVTVTTTGSGVEAGRMEIDAALTWSQESVTLDAKDAIRVNAPVSVGAATSELEIDIAAGNTGVLSFGRKGQITFASLSDIFGVDGGIFTLENSVQGLAAAITANPGGAYALANDYDASRDGTYKASPISTTLTGSVEGLGNTITGLSISAMHKTVGLNQIGLFSEIGTSARVVGLRLAGLNYKASGGRRATLELAGLAAVNNGSLINDEVSGKIAVIKYGQAGGLVHANNGTITTSSADVQIGGTGGGGLVDINNGTVKLSHASGNVRCGGGLVNENDAEISQSFAATRITCRSETFPWTGGLVGINGNGNYSADVNNSYSTGAVDGLTSAAVGGFVGDDGYDTIEYSYSTGMVSGTVNFGGFAGSFVYDDFFSDCYWDTTTSGTDNGVGGSNIPEVTGLTTAQLQSGLPAGFDPKIWAENAKINDGLPYLINNPPEK